ncbi:hypothetical protein HanXRQr2_Chr02g0049341 [Helianthus annuus]|uniref:Uncharacterized protein n=1 Tax=Helianthus annuus TaxID=4232 RepID=A0A251VER9_HELAN|nr:hypothetical protein HanXRQr2_Chr02g0049341 [Helianthus annuus]KAJ0950478.1 hypothetical protein HanPSC8_Chr02g0048721 [Helianthus annuus]
MEVSMDGIGTVPVPIPVPVPKIRVPNLNKTGYQIYRCVREGEGRLHRPQGDGEDAAGEGEMEGGATPVRDGPRTNPIPRILRQRLPHTPIKDKSHTICLTSKYENTPYIICMYQSTYLIFIGDKSNSKSSSLLYIHQNFVWS